MNKDIIYIDVDDDITSIIGKIKDAKQKIVALVPPKRTGVLQSAVNLRLLARAAEQDGKRMVLITGSSALSSLAAAANIPVARNLQSKPEIAQGPSADDGDDEDDIIDGVDLPIGDHARTSDDMGAGSTGVAFASPAVEDAIRENAAEETPRSIPAMPFRVPRNASGKSGVKIPNFDTFRKKLALGIGGGVLLVAFLIWAIMFAPKATIMITARTLDTSANAKVSLSPDVKTDFASSQLKAVRHEIQKNVSITFDATGSKTVGEKSAGKVVFRNCETDTSQTVPAGTGISAAGKTYITQEPAAVPGAKGFAVCTTAGESNPVTVVAQDIGDEYDADSGTQFNVAGHPNSSMAFYFRAVATTDITGGSKKTVTVVSAADVQKATEELAGKNTESMKKQLGEKFDDKTVALDQTYSIDQSGLTPTPAVDQETPDGKAKLSGALKVSMLGVRKAEVARFLDVLFAKQADKKNDQRIYDNGAEKASFVDVTKAENGYSATLVATAKLGPKIDDAALKAQAKGKRYGDVQARLQQISGVENVDIKFSPFWVKTVPNDDKRITIEFKLDESK